MTFFIKPKKERNMKKTKLVGIICGLFAAYLPVSALSAECCLFCGECDAPAPTPTPISTPTDTCAFCGSGGSSSSSSSGTWNPGSNWSKAATKTCYIVTTDGIYAGTATITTSKKARNGKVSVKVVFKLATGKSATAKQTAFTPDADGSITATWANVSNIGAVELTITPDGELNGTAGSYEFSDAYDTGSGESDVFVHGAHTFSVDVGDYTLNEKYDLIYETIPVDVEVITSSKKWDCGTAPAIKYKKIDGEYVLTGLDDERKTNYSALKITFNSKKNTFSGSFRVYVTNEGSIERGKPALKACKFTVSGYISGSIGVGTAKCNALKASWPITVD